MTELLDYDTNEQAIFKVWPGSRSRGGRFADPYGIAWARRNYPNAPDPVQKLTESFVAYDARSLSKSPEQIQTGIAAAPSSPVGSTDSEKNTAAYEVIRKILQLNAGDVSDRTKYKEILGLEADNPTADEVQRRVRELRIQLHSDKLPENMRAEADDAVKIVSAAGDFFL